MVKDHAQYGILYHHNDLSGAPFFSVSCFWPNPFFHFYYSVCTQHRDIEHYNDTRQKIVELDCIKDKDGKPQTELDESTKAQRYTYKTTDIEAETSNRVVELLDQKVKFKVTPIKLTTLRNVDGLSANTIDSLYEFVDID